MLIFIKNSLIQNINIQMKTIFGVYFISPCLFLKRLFIFLKYKQDNDTAAEETQEPL